MMQSKPITGTVLAGMLLNYVDTLNKQSIPNVQTAWDAVIREELSEATKYVKTSIENNFADLVYPMDMPELLTKCDLIKSRAL